MKLTDPEACKTIADDLSKLHTKSPHNVNDNVNINLGIYSAKHPKTKVGTVRLFGSPELALPEKLLQGVIGTALCLLIVAGKCIFRKKKH